MAKVMIHVWYDVNDGKISAIGREPQGAEHKVIPIAGPRQGVLAAQIEEHEIRGLHESHRVDLLNKALVKVLPEQR